LETSIICLILSISIPFLSCAEVQEITNPTVIESEMNQAHYPIDNFSTGITKKPFGIYISPSTSPVQPERFSGYHTGVDVEVDDLSDVWVYAVSDGEVLSVREIDGYGGVIQVLFDIDGTEYTALYGHLDLGSSIISVGDQVYSGDRLAILGDAYSVETDGERKHLHFSLKPGLDYDLRGYVSTEEELSAWVDPEIVLK